MENSNLHHKNLVPDVDLHTNVIKTQYHQLSLTTALAKIANKQRGLRCHT